ncbi:11802_t:CDS:2, partial [Dentiscutata erythropus]
MSFSSFSTTSQIYVNFVTYDFNQRDCHIQGFLRLKKKTKFGHYKPSIDEKKNKINGIKGFLKIDKIHFEPVESEPDSIRYYLNDFSECKWCTLECCSQRTLARYDENLGPNEYSIQENKRIRNKTEKNQSQEQLLKDVQECIDDILVKKISKEEAIVKYAEKNPQWITRNPNNIAIICNA